ncbi:MAG TPA: MFS transporter [Thermoanaerobaculia bacterium]|nr:MFS transporter [Thermoanaerobaculia bacterium]
MAVIQTFRALQHRNFRLFFFGQMISLIGTWMQSVAQSWLIYRMTGSSALLGLVAFCSQFPMFLAAPIGGTVADRQDRRRILIFTQVASMVLALILAALTLSHAIRQWHIFVLAALLGVVNGFDIPVRQSFFVHMVGREDLMNAIALNSSIFNGARIVGPAIAGILVAAIGEGWCFLLNAVSYVAVIAGLLMMRVPKHEKPERSRSSTDELVDGFRFIRSAKPIVALLMLLGLVSFMGMPYSVLMPIFADRILHGGARGLGYLMCASGLGALTASVLLAARPSLRGLGRWVSVAAASFGLSLIAFGFSERFWLSALLLVPVGFSMMLQMASSNTLIQAMVPDAFRGRVMAVYSMMFSGMAPLGSLLAGVLAQRIGAPSTVAAGGIVCIAGAALFHRRLPGLRTEARVLIHGSETVIE